MRIRRRGRHGAPSQVEKVAQQAGKAAPAVALAGAIVVAPQASHALAASGKPTANTAASTSGTGTAAHLSAARTPATLDSVATHTVTVAATKQARHAAQAHSTTYHVQGGDTLSKIAKKFFRNNDWQYLYHENAKAIPNPDLIYVGQSLFIPATAPAHYALSGYVPRHAKPAQTAEVSARSTRHHSGGSAIEGTTDGGSVIVQSAAQGHYSCSSLEQLWEQAGGSSSEAHMAAEIAMAESGGNPNAYSPTNDRGLWQINGSNGALSTFNPYANAKAAITLSGNGTNWGPWTTYHSGAYSGKC